ncbi:RagB/SusD family nutrient uptake outer membrane protein [Mucilaginibacter terrae]|uniref:RagB/SusD family nutrient uptake outer membrane protein n=1 Tax=Mucilaginibacter terrae TaxID=1955052 RepID=UPI00363BE27D
MKKKILLIIGLGVMLNYSCQKDKLSPVSQTQVEETPAELYSTPARVLSQLLGLYGAGVRGIGGFASFYSGRVQVYGDIKAENWINTSGNQITGSNTWSQNVNTTSDEVLNIWQQGYYAINNANQFIEGMAAYGTTTVNNPVLAASYVGEAKFVRALSYYTLLQLYARPYADGNGARPGLPLRLTGNRVFANFDMARSTVAQIYDQILKDLNEAETDVQLAYSTAALNTTRAHRNTVIALKVRVLLTMGRYADVITEANKIVGTTTFTATAGTGPTGRVANALQPNIVNVFRTPYTTTESIFSCPFVAGTENPGTQNALAYYFYQNGNTPGVSEFYLNPAGALSDPNWKATDARKTGLTFTNATNSRVFITKFNSISPYPDWAPVLRYSEVLLSLAEAIARTSGVDARAIALLNAVRGRSDATTVFTAANFVNGTALADAIIQERNIEFLGEGLRNIDLMRTLRTIPAKGSTVQAIPTTDPRYIWPISGNELLYNRLIVNN